MKFLMGAGVFLMLAQLANAQTKQQIKKLDQGEPLSLNLALQQAQKNSPLLRQDVLNEKAANEDITGARSKYLPSLDAAAIAADGSPGAFALLGVDNNISSGERMGYGGALILKQDIYDFGRTGNEVDAAKARAEAQNKHQDISKAEIAMQVLQTYFNCSLMKSKIDDSKFIFSEAQVIARETDKFVTSGQRSIIERYLVDAQAKEAETQTAEYIQRADILQKRLAVELGRTDSLSCPSLEQSDADIVALENTTGTNPLLTARKSMLKVAQSELERAKSGNMPELVAIATGGYFQNDELNQKWNYSAGIGITFPIFEGYRIQSDIGRNSARYQAELAGYDALNQSVSDSDLKYEEQIKGLEVRLSFLEKEDKLAKEAFGISRKRYFSAQGTMVDLREALRNYDRILLEIDEARRDLFVARGTRALFNGARVND